MNIAMAQTITPINNSQKLDQVSNSNGAFKSGFAALLQSQSKNPSLNTEADKVNLAEVMQNILKLLTEDKSVDLNSIKLLDSSEITVEQIAELLETTDKELKDQISDLMSSLFGLLGNQSPILQQLNSVKKTMEDGQFLQGTNQLIAIVAKLPKELIAKINPEQFQFMTKTAKAVETIGNMVDLSNDDIKNLFNLKQGLQGLISKVEQILKAQSNQNKNGILQSSFQNILLDHKERHSNLVRPLETQSLGDAVETANTNTNIQNSLPQVTKVEQFILHVGKETRPVNYQQFVKDFSNILAKSQFIQGDGSSRLLIKLYPEHLGSLRIEVLQDNGVMTAKMFATSGAAKDILDSQLHQLKSAFSQQNIQVEKVDVIFSQPETQRFDRGNQQQQQQPSDQQKKSHNNEADEQTDVTFSDVLSQSLIEEKI